MKLTKIIILLSLTISLGFSQEQFERVLITKTSKKSSLSKIKKDLDSIGIKMYVQALPTGYYVYSPKYTNSKNSNYALKKIKTKFLHAKMLLIGSSKKTLEEDNININEEITEVIATEKLTDEKTDKYINFSLGYSNLSGSTNSLTASNISNTGMSYTIEGGYILNDSWSASAAYLNTSTSDISSHDFYGEMNYRYSIDNKLSVGGGILLGLSSLEIDCFSSSSASLNILYGYDLALDYEFIDKFIVFTKYQGLYKDHTINIDSTAKISFDYTHNTLVGIGYRF